MPSDPLSDMFRLLDVQSVLSGALIAGGTWSIHFPSPEEIKFWGIVKGCCWLQTDDSEEPIKLQAGDVLLMLRTPAMTLSSIPGAPPVSLQEVLSRQVGAVSRIGDSDDFMLIGGTVILDSKSASLLFDALPRNILIEGGVPQTAPLHWILDQLIIECANGPLGSDAASAQLTNLMFVHILRAYLRRDKTTAPGWLRLASDRRLAPALTLMHEQPGNNWRLPDLAKAAGMSRATFALHFKAAAGVGPLGYLTEWRMRLAERALRRGGVSIAQLAASLGYANESAFSHAFKRVTGRAPKRVRHDRLVGAA
jgi:AraC-like DNA-binding protein